MTCSPASPALVHARRRDRGPPGLPGDGRPPLDLHRLKRQVDRWGLEALNVRERRQPRMPNQTGPTSSRTSPAYPATGRGGSPPSSPGPSGAACGPEHGVWRAFARYNLNTRSKPALWPATDRLKSAKIPPPEAHDASRPGEKVGVDFTSAGLGPRARLAIHGIDVASCARANPRSSTASGSCTGRCGARAAGWRLER